MKSLVSRPQVRLMLPNLVGFKSAGVHQLLFCFSRSFYFRCLFDSVMKTELVIYHAGIKRVTECTYWTSHWFSFVGVYPIHALPVFLSLH